MNPKLPKKVVEDHHDTHLVSSAVFLQDAQFDSGSTNRYNVRLEILPKPPKHAGKGSVIWSLEATIDVAWARDVRMRHPVEIALQ